MFDLDITIAPSRGHQVENRTKLNKNIDIKRFIFILKWWFSCDFIFILATIKIIIDISWNIKSGDKLDKESKLLEL